LTAIEIDGDLLVDPTGERTASAGPFFGTGEYVSNTTSTIELTNFGGRWCNDEQSVGLDASSDSEYTDLGVDPDSARFTSANGTPLSVVFTGQLTEFESRIWSISSSADGTNYGAFVAYEDTSVSATQTGATMWQPPAGTLAFNIYYRVKVTYRGANASDVTSSEINFKTASATRSLDGLYFYDEFDQVVIRESQLADYYGTDEADNDLGTYALTEQPSYQVIGYEKQGSEYAPLRDYTPEADQYLDYLRSAVVAWGVGNNYNQGDIIAFNGQLYRALTSATSTSNNDPTDNTSDWESLGIST